ncbi:MAG: threonine/serine dehydratase, partial [Gammaproteobacteria bacterium]
DVRAARDRIASRVPATPLVASPILSASLGAPLALKCELMQKTGSFKPRGALNWVLTASREELDRGLITISAGNHALALAWAASEVGARVTVVMPDGSSELKVEATRAYGAEVILRGDIHEAMDHMESLRAERGLVLVHPFADPRIVAGQGTVGLEILEQSPEVEQILCPVGGGGLISGIGVAVKSQRPAVRLVGLETEGAPTLRAAWDRGGPVRLEQVRTVAPSLGAALTGELNYMLTREYVDDVVTLPEADVRIGVRETFSSAKLFAEPGATLGIAALVQHRVEPSGVTVVVVTGGNFDFGEARGFL